MLCGSYSCCLAVACRFVHRIFPNQMSRSQIFSLCLIAALWLSAEASVADVAGLNHAHALYLSDTGQALPAVATLPDHSTNAVAGEVYAQANMAHDAIIALACAQ